jgi:hypothetical protein
MMNEGQPRRYSRDYHFGALPHDGLIHMIDAESEEALPLCRCSPDGRWGKHDFGAVTCPACRMAVADREIKKIAQGG